MSSRLFQEIQEKLGLAYAVYSFLSSYQDAGLMASTPPSPLTMSRLLLKSCGTRS
ncbi:MAG: insulinase family protein [Dissulfurimicrobium sp.]|uniref:insulinase family protein n=1 Tax=Dissulfurimicrobium sp. TaxID=2022436 RepID=UPI004048EB61